MNEKEMPARIWIDEALGMVGYINEPPPPESDFRYEYVPADLLATARKEAREAALREAVNWAKKVHGVKVNAANDATADDEFAAMRLGHEADGVQRVIDTLEAALERVAATDTDKTERG